MQKSYFPEAPKFEEVLRTVFSQEEAEYRITHTRGDVEELKAFLSGFRVRNT
jgi:hypothetical protein